MRKRKRALNKLEAAKKKANAMAESTDMTQRDKVKAINRAMKSAKISKPGKVYVITKKTGGASSGTKSSNDKVMSSLPLCILAHTLLHPTQTLSTVSHYYDHDHQGKLKFVDKRLKKDKRAEKASKKRRRG
jgi:hypothetical protein